MVGSVGEVLALYGYTVVVAVWTSGLAERGAVEPVAGVYLYGRLVSPYLEAAAGDFRTEFSCLFKAGSTIEYPAVVVALAVFQGREVGLDVAARPMGLAVRKSIGVPSTGANSPVGIRASEVASQRGALSFSTWSRMEPLSSPSKFQ